MIPDTGVGTLGLPDVRASDPNQPVKSDPSKEYVVGGPWAGFTPSGGYLIAQAIDDVVRQYGPWVYELMRQDPGVAASLYLLYAAILAEGPRVVSSVVADPGEQSKSRRRKRELKLAEEIAAYWQRQIEGLKPDFDQVLWELIDDAATGGCSLAEPVYTEEPIDSGPDKGRLGLKSFQIKPRWAWGMRVDPFMRVQRIRAWTTEGWYDIDRAHFVMLTWGPRNGDPRGTRILRPAYPSWNVKLQAIPDYSEYLRHHADPKLILNAGPNAESTTFTDPMTGAKTTLTPQQRLIQAAQQFGNRSILALAYGETATYLYSQGNGEAYLKGFDWADREIFRSIIVSARPMQEAKHGSKADSGSGMDLIGMAVSQSRKPPKSAIRNDLFYTGTLLNWGKEVADRFTPHLTFGVTDSLSPELMKALGDAWAKGVFQVPQRAWMLSKLGAPLDPEGYIPNVPGAVMLRDPTQDPATAGTQDDQDKEDQDPEAQSKGKDATTDQDQDDEDRTDD